MDTQYLGQGVVSKEKERNITSLWCRYTFTKSASLNRVVGEQNAMTLGIWHPTSCKCNANRQPACVRFGSARSPINCDEAPRVTRGQAEFEIRPWLHHVRFASPRSDASLRARSRTRPQKARRLTSQWSTTPRAPAAPNATVSPARSAPHSFVLVRIADPFCFPRRRPPKSNREQILQRNRPLPRRPPNRRHTRADSKLLLRVRAAAVVRSE